MLENNLIKANEDIVTISTIAKRMGWGAVSEQSFQRILYLVQIHTLLNMQGKIYSPITTLR